MVSIKWNISSEGLHNGRTCFKQLCMQTVFIVICVMEAFSNLLVFLDYISSFVSMNMQIVFIVICVFMEITE